MKNENQRIAKELMQYIKDEDVLSLHHCSTRLRFKFIDGYTIDEKIEKIKGVLGVVKSMGGYQIIMGNNVSDVYKEIVADHTFKNNDQIESLETSAAKKKANIFETFLGAMSAIVGEVVPAIIASGLVSALIAVLKLIGINAESTTMQYLTALSNVALYFLPFLLAYSASKYFKTSPIMSIFVAGLLMHPTVLQLAASESVVTLFGIPVYKVDYSSSLVPIILTVWALKYVTKYIEKFVPASIKYVFVPLLTALIMLPIALLITGPIGGVIGYLLSQFTVLLSEYVPGLGVLVLSIVSVGRK